jgi:hypothetical protein
MSPTPPTTIDIDRLRSMLGNPLLADYLTWKYPTERLLCRGGATYPVVVLPACPGQRREIESLLGTLSLAKPDPSTYVSNDPRYLDAVVAHNLFTLPMSIDRMTYTLTSIDQTADRLCCHARVGSFLESALSSEILDVECRAALAEHVPGESLSQFDQRLPLRNAIHALLSDPCRDGRGRASALAMTVLVVYKHRGRFFAMMKRRAHRGAPLYASCFQAAPSFMLQALSLHWAREEFSLRHQVYREILEEIFSYPEYGEGDVQRPDYFMDDPRLRYLQEIERAGGSTLFAAGIGINLLNLRSDLLALYYIDDEAWAETCQVQPGFRWQFNDEWDTHADNHLSAEAFTAGISLDLAAPDDALLRMAHLDPRWTTPAGAAAFWTGIDILRWLQT